MLGPELQRRLQESRPPESKPGTLYLLADAYSRLYQSNLSTLRYAWSGDLNAIIELAQLAMHSGEDPNWAASNLRDILRLFREDYERARTADEDLTQHPLALLCNKRNSAFTDFYLSEIERNPTRHIIARYLINPKDEIFLDDFLTLMFQAQTRIFLDLHRLEFERHRGAVQASQEHQNALLEEAKRRAEENDVIATLIQDFELSDDQDMGFPLFCFQEVGRTNAAGEQPVKSLLDEYFSNYKNDEKKLTAEIMKAAGGDDLNEWMARYFTEEGLAELQREIAPLTFDPHDADYLNHLIELFSKLSLPEQITYLQQISHPDQDVYEFAQQTAWPLAGQLRTILVNLMQVLQLHPSERTLPEEVVSQQTIDRRAVLSSIFPTFCQKFQEVTAEQERQFRDMEARDMEAPTQPQRPSAAAAVAAARGYGELEEGAGGGAAEEEEEEAAVLRRRRTVPPVGAGGSSAH